MTITLLGGRYRLKPYQTHGRRCWELYVGRRTGPECYPDSLGFALRWIAEYEIRNGSDDVADIGAALERYESICQSLADAAESALSGGSAGD